MAAWKNCISNLSKRLPSPHALGTGQGCAPRSDSSTDRGRCSHPNLVWAAPPLCPDIVFGRDTPLGDEEAEWVDRRQSVARGSSDDRGTVLDGDRLRCREKTAVRVGSKCVDAGLNV